MAIVSLPDSPFLSIMSSSLQAISLSGLVWAFAPTLVVLVILYRWGLDTKSSLHAVTRMLVQLLLIGYVLLFIFETKHAGVIISVLGLMLVAASWIALRPVRHKQPHLYRNALIANLVGGGLTLGLTTQVVLEVQPWFLPRYVVPLAGMLFASSMNAVSLAAERYEAECGGGRPYADARNSAFQAALIPVTNSLFAVGIVSLPGMMTGQILSGVSPLIAAKYQIVIMCTIFGSAGISAAIYLRLAKGQA